LLFVTEIFHLREQWKGHSAAGPEYRGTVIGIRYTSGRRANVWSLGLAFSDLSVALH